MKEVRCNTAQECGHWCHAAGPHPVNEACERSYCMEVRRQVQCVPVPVPVTRPPVTCSRRTRDLCDLSGMPCPIVYDGVTCRRGRPPSAAEVAEADVEERRYEDARQVWAESQGADDLGELRALAHDRDMAQRSVWHAFGHRTYRGIPVVKSDNLVPEAPGTMTAAVYEESVRAAALDVLCCGMHEPTWRELLPLADQAKAIAAAVATLPRIRQEGGTGE